MFYLWNFQFICVFGSVNIHTLTMTFPKLLVFSIIICLEKRTWPIILALYATIFRLTEKTYQRYTILYIYYQRWEPASFTDKTYATFRVKISDLALAQNHSPKCSENYRNRLDQYYSIEHTPFDIYFIYFNNKIL